MTTAPPGTGRRTRVLLADDSEGLRLLVRSWLTSEADLEVVAEASNGAEAVALADAHRPDVVVMDVAMPVMDGLEALTELHRRFPELPVVMHSGFAEGQVARQAAARGAWGFVEKSGDLEPLVRALRTAAQGSPGPVDLPSPRNPVPAAPAPPVAVAPERPRGVGLRARRVAQRQQEVSAAVEASNRALAQANDQLRLLNLDLQASNDDLRQFGQIAGHDLVEPLRTIRSFTDLLQQRCADQLDDRGQQYLHFVADGVARMQDLVEDLRAYTRAGQAELHLAPVPLDVVVQDARAALRLRLAERGARVRVGPLPVVRGDRSLLGLVVQNLLSNALTFNDSAAPVVEINAERAGDQWKVHVRDDGIGIDPGRADAVFGLFARLHTREEYPGTGLGLAITKRIVERHGGSVALTPRSGGGTTATVTLPAVPAAA